MLPFLQRLASALSGRGVAALAGICLLWDGLWPLAAHYVPAISPPAYLDAPLFTVYVGLFFAGYWLRRFFSPTRGRMRLAWAVLAASLLASVLLTFVEYGRVAPGEKYWFMDDRMHPSLLTAMSAASAMALMRGARWPKRHGRALTELGGCAFGMYLAQDWLIAQTQERLFLPLCGALPHRLVSRYHQMSFCGMPSSSTRARSLSRFSSRCEPPMISPIFGNSTSMARTVLPSSFCFM